MHLRRFTMRYSLVAVHLKLVNNQEDTTMKAMSKVSLILGAVTAALGYAIVIVNIIGLRKSRKISKIIE